jgi:hypothetical protein
MAIEANAQAMVEVLASTNRLTAAGPDGGRAAAG